MNLAVVQLRTPLLNVPRARAMLLAAVEQAVKARADLVLLPELCTTGYPLNSREEALSVAEPTKGGMTARMVQELLARLGSAALVAYGYPEVARDGRLYNSMALVSARGVEQNYRKVALYKADKPWATRGSRRMLWNVKGLLVAPGICADGSDPDYWKFLARAQPDLVLFSSCWVTDPVDPPEKWAVMTYFGAYLAAADRWGEDRGVPYPGRSCVLPPESEGETLVAAGETGDCILLCTVPAPKG
jgi:predicted amidohydrolase